MSSRDIGIATGIVVVSSGVATGIPLASIGWWAGEWTIDVVLVALGCALVSSVSAVRRRVLPPIRAATSLDAALDVARRGLDDRAKAMARADAQRNRIRAWIEAGPAVSVVRRRGHIADGIADALAEARRHVDRIPRHDLTDGTRGMLADCDAGLDQMFEILGALRDLAPLDTPDDPRMDLDAVVAAVRCLAAHSLRNHGLLQTDPSLGGASGSGPLGIQLLLRLILDWPPNRFTGAEWRLRVAERADSDVEVRLAGPATARIGAADHQPWVVAREIARRCGGSVVVAHTADTTEVTIHLPAG